mmetsp:Transcript_14680/g.39304  ORF Transcript_14680/g.39304 Transcript_14680/m.39304 type:complete len:259 (+) Transcript_14680:874-1650(+)
MLLRLAHALGSWCAAGFGRASAGELTTAAKAAPRLLSTPQERVVSGWLEVSSRSMAVVKMRSQLWDKAQRGLGCTGRVSGSACVLSWGAAAAQSMGCAMQLGGVRYASKKAKGSTKNGKSPGGKRLGIKCVDGKAVRPGMILVKQRGTKYRPSVGVARARDSSLFSLEYGKVRYVREKNPNSAMHDRVYLTIEPHAPPEGLGADGHTASPMKFSKRFSKSRWSMKFKRSVPVYKPQTVADKFTRMANSSSLEEALSFF